MAVSSYEFSGCSFAVCFAVLGGWAGWIWLGPFGALAGIPLGLVTGWFAGWLLVEASFASSIRAEVRHRRRVLRPFFGEYWRPDREADWNRVARDLKEGDTLSGHVVAEFYYGVALDVGLGFPAILTKLRYRQPFSENPPIGAEATARIDEIKAANRELHLTQGRTYRESVGDSEGRTSMKNSDR